MLETSGAGFFLNLLKFIYKLVPLPAVIKVNVISLTYSSLRSHPDSPLIVISSSPSRYHLTAELSNLRGRKTTVRDAILKIGDKGEFRAVDFESFRLMPGDMKKIDLIFPVDEAEAVEAGGFEARFIDIYGKKFKAKGTFPILRY